MQLHDWCCPGEFRNISEAWEIFLRSAIWFLDERSQESVFVRSPADSSRNDLSIYNERSSTSVEGLATVKTSIGLTRTRRPSRFFGKPVDSRRRDWSLWRCSTLVDTCQPPSILMVFCENLSSLSSLSSTEFWSSFNIALIVS